MKPIQAYAPSVVVFVTAVLVLLLGPYAVRSLTYSQTKARILQASERLASNDVLEQLNQAGRDLAMIVEPSVVHVSTSARIQDRSGTAAQVTSSGSGWVYDEQGHIVSNAHVVDGADQIQVQLYTGEYYDADVVGIDLRSDIAVLKIPARHLVPAQRSSMENVEQGEFVFAFGSPFDFRFSMSAGIVSGLGRSAGLTDIEYENFIQVDAAINPGNSGGPLTDVKGRVVGMNTAIATGRGNGSLGQGLFAGIGLAIPMSMIESVVDQLIEKGEVDKGYMGVNVAELTAPIARALTFNGDGVLISTVTPGGPADRAGLQPNDIITHVEGQAVDTTRQIPAIVASHRPGQVVTFRIWRLDPSNGGQALEIPVTLDRLDPADLAVRAARIVEDFGLIDLVTSNPVRAAESGVPFQRGVLVRNLIPRTDAANLLEPGSIISAVNGQPIASLEEFYVRLERYHTLLRQRRISGSATLNVVLPSGEAVDVRMPIDLN